MKKKVEKFADCWTRIVFGGMLIGTGYIFAKTGVKIINEGII